jgi:hypothetical protein
MMTCLSASLQPIKQSLGRFANRQALLSASTALYQRLPLFRLISREIVDGERFNRRAMDSNT